MAAKKKVFNKHFIWAVLIGAGMLVLIVECLILLFMKDEPASTDTGSTTSELTSDWTASGIPDLEGVEVPSDQLDVSVPGYEIIYRYYIDPRAGTAAGGSAGNQAYGPFPVSSKPVYHRVTSSNASALSSGQRPASGSSQPTVSGDAGSGSTSGETGSQSSGASGGGEQASSGTNGGDSTSSGANSSGGSASSGTNSGGGSSQQTERVVLRALSESVSLEAGVTGTVRFVLEPSDARLSISAESNLQVVRKGQSIEITASRRSQEKSEITLTGTKPGYTTATARISVSVYIPPTKGEMAELADKVFALTVTEREKAGITTTLQKKLDIEEEVMQRAVEISTKFSHTRPDGTEFYTIYGVSKNFNYAENIAAGPKSPAEALKSWMNEDNYRESILNDKYTGLAVGVYRDASGRLYWVQCFYRD